MTGGFIEDRWTLIKPDLGEYRKWPYVPARSRLLPSYINRFSFVRSNQAALLVLQFSRLSYIQYGCLRRSSTNRDHDSSRRMCNFRRERRIKKLASIPRSWKCNAIKNLVSRKWPDTCTPYHLLTWDTLKFQFYLLSLHAFCLKGRYQYYTTPLAAVGLSLEKKSIPVAGWARLSV